MAIYTLHHFSHAEVLENIVPELLEPVIRRYADYFSINGYALPEHHFEEGDLREIALRLENPVFDGDTKIFDALELIEAMAKPQYASVVVDELDRMKERRDFKKKYAAINNAILLYTLDHNIPVRLRENLALEKPGSYKVVKGEPVLDFTYQEDMSTALTAAFDNLLDDKGQGRGAQVRHYFVDGLHYFAIRRGLPYARHSIIDSELKSTGIYIREEASDIIILSAESGELKMAISEARQWMKLLFPRIFGECLFHDAEYFSVNRIYNLSVVDEKGEDAIKCNPGDPFSDVIATKIKYLDAWSADTLIDGLAVNAEDEDNLFHEVTGKNFFRSMRKRKKTMSDYGPLVEIKLVFFFPDGTDRKVTLNNGDKGNIQA